MSKKIVVTGGSGAACDSRPRGAEDCLKRTPGRLLFARGQVSGKRFQ